MTISELAPPIETRVAGDPQPDPGAARDRISAFESENADALLDVGHVGHRHAVKERSRLYSAAFGDDPVTLTDVPSDAEPLETGDHAAAIGRVIGRYGGTGEEATAFAGDLAAAGISAAEMAPMAREIASSSPLQDHELIARVSRQDMWDAAALLAANPELDDLIADYDLHRYPVVLRELARRHREHK